MTQHPFVAIARAPRRRDAVASALAEIRTAIAERLEPAHAVVIKPNLVSHRDQAPSTHADAFGPVLDHVLAAGCARVVVAEGATDARAGFRRMGLVGEAWNRPVHFFDINREENAWEPLTLRGVDGQSRSARLSRTIVGSDCRISLAVAKTHMTAGVTLSIKNMLSSIHPEDRIRMHGYDGASGFAGWRAGLVALLKQDHLVAKAANRLLGHLRRARFAWRGIDRPTGWSKLAPNDLAFLRSIYVMQHNLVALARRTAPQISVVDAFDAMHREGPRHGTPIRIGTVIAGTDPVAVDAIATAVMGLDPKAVGYLQLAERAGLGTADLDRITILGDRLDEVRVGCVPHSNDPLHRIWNRLPALDPRHADSPSPLYRPHVRPVQPLRDALHHEESF